MACPCTRPGFAQEECRELQKYHGLPTHNKLLPYSLFLAALPCLLRHTGLRTSIQRRNVALHYRSNPSDSHPVIPLFDLSEKGEVIVRQNLLDKTPPAQQHACQPWGLQSPRLGAVNIKASSAELVVTKKKNRRDGQQENRWCTSSSSRGRWRPAAAPRQLGLVASPMVAVGRRSTVG